MERILACTAFGTGPSRRQLLSAVGLIAATAALTGCGVSEKPSVSTDVATPGAPGVGDGYTPAAGNGGYDVASYAIVNRVELNPPRIATGQTTVTGTAIQALSRFNLDFSLVVDSVTVNGQPADFHLGGTELVITPGTAIPAGAPFTAVVNYHSAGQPKAWFVSDGEILVTGEPEVAQWWFPSNDHPRDVAHFDVVLDVPAGMTGVSVGRLVDHHDADGRSVWHWVSSEPMASYVSFFSVGDFDTTNDDVEGVAYRYFVSRRLSPEQRRTNMSMLRRTPMYVAALERDFGRYPYVDGGGLVSSALPSEDAAMEDQTRPTYPVMEDTVDGRRLIVHELAHQWFGDHVRVDRWRDIILNEAFARWSEIRWMETGEAIPANQTLRSMYDEYDSSDPFWELVLDDPGVDHLFDSPIYDRGGMMVQALRNKVGEDAFFRIIKTWISQNAGKTARVSDFERLAAQSSGQDLSDFFRVWLRDRTKPADTAANGLAV